MNPLWTPILSEQQPLAAQTSDTHSYPLTDYYPLTEWTIITVTGPDVVKFLQGQCTCDFNQLTADNWLLGAHCNAKGRMIFSFVAALTAPESIGLRVHYSIADTALAALKKYAVFSKVTLEQSTLVAVASNSPSDLSDLPSTDLKYNLGGEPWQEAWLEAKTLEENPAALSTGNAWQQASLKAGIAHIQADTREQYLPQALNYDLVDGVNFKKGCYTGQEIIARLHYRGQSKQRLHLALCVSDHAPTVGGTVNDAQQKSVGEVIDCCKTDKGFLVQLCTSAHAQPAESLTLLDQPQAPLQALPLPYAIP